MQWYSRLIEWRTENLIEGDGVVVGADQFQEWLFPWWWDNFVKHNNCPVTFVDFGLSVEKKNWCQERGELITLPFLDMLIKDKDEVDTERAEKWENRYGEYFWDYRKAWFKKPLACLQSPYRRTIWLDLDCEVLGPLSDLFKASEHTAGIALIKDAISDESLFPIYNSGVIAFQRNAPLLTAWAEQSLEKNGEFRGDQDLLSQIIYESGAAICEMPAVYNWNVAYGLNPSTIICHWIGDRGKHALRDQLILKAFTE